MRNKYTRQLYPGFRIMKQFQAQSVINGLFIIIFRLTHVTDNIIQINFS